MTDARAQQLLRATLRLFDLAGLRDRYVLIGGAAVRAYDGSRVLRYFGPQCGPLPPSCGRGAVICRSAGSWP